ncbi:MAG: hypothetical protein ACE5I1_20980 [bacterium]
MKPSTILCFSVLTLFFNFTQLSAQWKGFSSISENIKASDGIITQLRLEWSGGARQVKAQLQGTMELYADREEIKRISEGGSFVLEERSGKIYRQVIVSSDKGEKLEYRYEVQAEPAVFSGIAKQWFDDLLLEIVHEAGINSRQRAQAIYAVSGEQGILREISQIERERSKRFYYERLLENKFVSDSTLIAVAQQIKNEFTADVNLRIVISDIVSKHKMSDRTLIELLRAVKEVNNEVTQANLLTDIATILPNDQKVVAFYRKVANAIHSDVERQRALSATK